MTTIDRVGILGIRSYGVDEEAVIKFYKPLTIILGRNGSGKSTIIEAVKLATTGDLPPVIADKGAAVIHDPRIDNNTETRAKIRLMFTNLRGDQYLVAKHFSLNIKKGPRGVGYKTEFKTLDATLRKYDPNGVNKTSSFRKGDMNNIVPEVMRVTKPVLNNVIFVHQEDSFWPLGDTKRLKEKFDEIFAATRYTKALDSIKKYRKEQAAELRTVQVELMHYGQKVEVLSKLAKEYESLKENRDGLQKGVDALDASINDLRRKREAADRIKAKFEEKTAELQNFTIKEGIVENEKKEKFAAMENHLPDLSDENIRHEIDELRQAVDRADFERAQRAKRIEEITTDIENKREEFNNRQNRRGMLQQQAKMQSDRIAELESMKKDFIASEIFSKPLTDKGSEIVAPTSGGKLEDWSKALRLLLQDAEQNLNKVTEECNSRVDKANEHVSNVKIKLQSAKKDLQRKNSEVVEKRSELTKVRNELRDLEDSQVSIDDTEKKLKAAEKAFADKNEKSKVASIESNIVKQKRSVASLREDLTGLRRTREQLVQDQSEQARLDLSKDAAQTKKKHLDSTAEDFCETLVSAIDGLMSNDKEGSDLGDIRADLKSTLASSNPNWQQQRNELLEASRRVLARRDVLLQGAERRVNEIKVNMQSVDSKKTELARQIEESEKELSETETILSTTTSELRELGECDVKLDDVIEMFQNVRLSNSTSRNMVKQEHLKTVQDTVEVVDNAVVKASQKISQIESGFYLSQGDLEAFEEDDKHRCPACGLSSTKRLEDMRRNLQKRVDFFKDPESLEKAKNDLSSLESASRVIRKLHTHCSTAISTCKSFTVTTSKLKEVEVAVKQESSKCEAESLRFSELRKNIGSGSPLDHISPKALELKQAFLEFERATKEVAVLQSSLSASTGETRSLSEVDSGIREIEEEMQNTQDEIERCGRALDREKEDLRRAENRMHSAKQQALEQQAMSERYKRLEAERSVLRRTIESLEKEIENLRTMSTTINDELERAEEDFQIARGDNTLNLRAANTTLNDRRTKVNSWKDVASAVEAYISTGKEGEYKLLCRSLEGMKTDIEAKSADLKEYEKEQQIAADSQKEMEAKTRNLRDNQRYRLQEQELSIVQRNVRRVKEEIQQLEQEAGEYPPRKVQKLTEEINKLNADRHATEGRLHVYKDRCKEKQQDVAQAEKEGSKRKFDACRIKKQTQELALSDLDRYHRALDQAVMAFHALKMSSINRTIKELWQATYRGTDIDEIEIVSDHEMLNAGGNEGTGVKPSILKRNFQYRVKMRQGQATLDMRGRCSAGQKVLACIVIRLALAESFCSECGILALDEPTTNLDRENVESLAEALRAIIENRRHQRNFQLVLITHDEEFINMIGARSFCNEFLKVYKDPEGLSRAKIENLQEAMG